MNVNEVIDVLKTVEPQLRTMVTGHTAYVGVTLDAHGSTYQVTTNDANGSSESYSQRVPVGVETPSV